MAQPLYPTPMKSKFKYCAATISYDENITLRYIEQHKPLMKEHITMYSELRRFIDDILCNKTPWKLSKLPTKLLQIVDNNYQHHGKIYATPDLYRYLQYYATSQTLIACCIGSNYNIAIAKQCILDIVQWRVCSKIDDIHPELFKNSLQSKTVFNINEFDKNGHPICHFKVLETPPDDPWTIVRAVVYTMEKCIKLTEANNLYQILWLVDLQHLSYSTMPPMEILKEVSNLMTYYYPERLCKSYLLFAPWVFNAIFAMTKPYLPTGTQRKFVNPSWYESAVYDTFKHDIDRKDLVQRYGGDHNVKYDYEWELNEWNNLNPKQKQTDDMDDEKADILEEEDEDDSKLCIVCLDGNRDHVLIPCGHLCVCGQCKDSYSGNDAQCPLCRAKVELVVKTFS